MRESEYLETSVDLMEKLRSLPTLSLFKDEDLQVLVRHSKLRTYESGELILEEDTHDNWLFFMISGKVKVVKKGKELATIERLGEIFGEMRIIDGSARFASIRAMKETVCLAANVADVDNLSGEERVTFGYVLYRLFAQILAKRLRLAHEKLIQDDGSGENKVDNTNSEFEWK